MKNSVFVHLPKTGGTWVARALQKQRLSVKIVGNKKSHNAPHYVPSADEYPDKIVFCFVRNPIEWYRSFWSFCTDKKSMWKIPAWSDIRSCESGDFNDFIVKVVDLFPNGYLSSILYPRFTERCNFVGKQENLLQDLITVLTKAGEDFNVDKLTERNENKERVVGQIMKWQSLTQYKPEVLELLKNAEKEAVLKYDYV